MAWQAREAALRAIAAVEGVGHPLPGWTGSYGFRDLPLIPVAGQDLNAYYDRNSISFFVTRVAGNDIFSGASTDVVAHETGHAILDAIRPDLWGVNLMEVGAFHEGFGDIIAIFTALADKDTRTALLAVGLRQANYIEATAEQLSDAIFKIKGPSHPASAPRRALNAFKWSFPTSLPANGPPNVLINEEHSLGQLASGIFYDLVCEIYARDNAGGQAALWKAAQAAMDLTLKATQAVSVRPRFFETWGRAMALIDSQASAGANEGVIKTAFSNHGILVSTTAALAPRLRLQQFGSRKTRSGQLMTAAARRRLRSALGVAPGERLTEREVELGDGPVLEVSAMKWVELTGLSERLSDVVARVPHPALIGEVDSGPAVLGAIENEFAYNQEVRDYVETLLRHDAIDFDKRARKRKSEVGSTMSPKSASIIAGEGKTHEIVVKNGQRLLERVSFACGCRSFGRTGSRS